MSEDKNKSVSDGRIIDGASASAENGTDKVTVIADAADLTSGRKNRKKMSPDELAAEAWNIAKAENSQDMPEIKSGRSRRRLSPAELAEQAQKYVGDTRIFNDNADDDDVNADFSSTENKPEATADNTSDEKTIADYTVAASDEKTIADYTVAANTASIAGGYAQGSYTQGGYAQNEQEAVSDNAGEFDFTDYMPAPEQTREVPRPYTPSIPRERKKSSHKAMRRDTLREFRKSFSRFLSIAVIVGLGTGFFAGIKSTAPSIRRTADNYFNEYNVMDMKLLSTVGFDDADVQKVAQTDGVKDVVPSYSLDAIIDAEDSAGVIKLISMPLTDTEVNGVMLVEGRLPEKSGECAAVASEFLLDGYKIGDTIKIAANAGATVTDEVLDTRQFTVVGLIRDSSYFSYSFGTTTIGDGTISTYAVILPEDFTYERYTELYLTLDCHDEGVTAFDEQYQSTVDAMQLQLEDVGKVQYEIFSNDILNKINEAQSEYDEQSGEADTAIATSLAELNDAKAKLDDARLELDNGWDEYNTKKTEVETTIADYEALLASKQREIENGEVLLAQGKIDYANGLADSDEQFSEARLKLEAAKTELDAAKIQLDEGEDEYNANLALYNDGLAKLAESEKEYNDGLAQYNDGLALFNEKKKEYDEGNEEYKTGLEEYEAKKKEYDDGLKEYEEGREKYDQGVAEYEEGKDKIAEYYDGLNKYEQKQDEYNKGVTEYNNGLKEYETKKAEYDKGLAEYNAGKAEYDKNAALLEPAKTELAAARAEIDAKTEEYNTGNTEYQAALKKYDDTVNALDAYDTVKSAAQTLINSIQNGGIPDATAITTIMGAAPVLAQYASLYIDLSTIDWTDAGAVEDAMNEIINLDTDAARTELAAGAAELETAKSELAAAKVQLDAAEAEYSKAEAEYNKGAEQIVAAKKELDAAKAELDAGAKSLDAAKAELDEGKKELDDGKKELDAAKKQLDSSKKEVEDAEKKLKTAEKELTDNKKKLDEAKKQLDTGKIELNTAKNKLDSSKKLLESGKKELDAKQKELDAAKAKLSTADFEIKKAKQTLDDSKKQLTEGKATLDEKTAEYNSGIAEYNKGESEYLTQLESTDKALADAKKAIDENEAKIYDGKRLIAQYTKEIAAGKVTADTELADALTKLENGETEYSASLIEYENGRKEYDEKVAEVEAKLSDASMQIRNARNEFEEIESGKWYVMSRDDVVVNYNTLDDDIINIDALASVFPVFFLAVAALVCLTTIKRMVDELRGELGTYKALGYSTGMIMQKYLTYALVATFIGSLIGETLAVMILPQAIFSSYKKLYDFGKITIQPSWTMVAVAFAAALVCTVAVAFYSCYSELRERPATLMRPKSPPPGREIFLYRIKPLWNALGFSQKNTLRNIFRNKSRMIMTVVGIAGCMALMVTGFGLHDSISSIVPSHFGRIVNYDMRATFIDSTPVSQMQTTTDYYNSDSRIDSYLLTYQMNAEVTKNNGESIETLENMSADEAKDMTEIDANIIVPITESTEELEKFYNFYSSSRSNKGDKLTLGDDEAILTEKMCKKLGVSVGDTINIKSGDNYYNVRVGGISEYYIEYEMFLSEKLYNEIFGKELKYNCVFINLTDSAKDNSAAVMNDLLENDKNIMYILPIETYKCVFEDVLDNIKAIIYIMIVCAGSLAFVVVYNLTNINISERLREIATIKVLGFKTMEVNKYIFSENILMAVAGLLLGCVGGYFLDQFIISTVEVDMIMFSRILEPTSYLFASLLTMLFVVLVSIVMSKRMKDINMVESLKAVD